VEGMGDETGETIGSHLCLPGQPLQKNRPSCLHEPEKDGSEEKSACYEFILSMHVLVAVSRCLAEITSDKSY
jgi:hypothetical protein